MRFYAERPVRLARQVVTDLLVVGWVAVCGLVARAVYELVLQLQVPGRTLTDAGESVRGAFDSAARTAAEVPFVGADLAGALGTGTGAGDSLSTAGRQLVDTVAAVASGLVVAILVLGALPVVVVWLVVRVRYARAAASAVAARSHGTQLLALQALTRQPTRRLLAVAPDPAAAWKRDDPDAVRALAALELRSLGLR
jgi:hypothetical protein